MVDERAQGIRFAHFDEDSATFTSISENNSVMYKLEVRGSNSDSNKPARIRFNGNEIVGIGYKTGLNLKVLTETGSIFEEKVFSGSGSYAAMRDYLNDLKGDYVVAIASHGELTADQASDNILFNLGSISYPNHLFLKIINKVSYAAIFSNKMKKIVCEGMQATNGQGQDSSIQIEKVYDRMDDLAVTGTPQRVIEDFTEYQSTTVDDFEMVQYPHEAIYAPLSTYNIKSGDTLLVSAEIFRDEAAKNANISARFFHNYFADGVYKNGVRVNTQSFNRWEKFERVYVVPEGVDTVVTGCMRYPSNSSEGVVKVRNILVTHISGEVKQDGNTSFGVNGVRTTHIQDNGDFANPVMQLLRLPIDNKRITSNNFKEFPID